MIGANSIENEIWNGLEYYPNPVTDHLNISIPNLKGAIEVHVMDYRSRVIQTNSFLNGQMINIDMSELSSGIYILQLKNGEESKDLKIVKK